MTAGLRRPLPDILGPVSSLHEPTPEAPRIGTPEWRAARILERLDTLFEIGRAAGTNRPGLGEGEQRAFELVAGWMREAGLEVEFDAAGNVVGRLAGSDPDLPEIWSGSHLDTPPDGGRFDGALGTLLALDAAEAMRADGPPRRTVAAMAFRLEEGPRFGRGYFGSRAVCGALDGDEGDLVDPDGITLAEAFAALGYGELPRTGWLDPAPAAFVEAHIEQGPTLAAMEAALGIVTSIAGMAGLELTFTGRRGHAGTVQMQHRSDALGAAARFVTGAHDVARSLPGAVATIGRLTISPGATNTIPERAELFADLRAPDDERVEALVEGVTAAAHDAAQAARCEVAIETSWRYEAVAMSDPPRAALQRAVAALGLEPVELPSGAGHDAAILALAGVPSAMLFVRSDAGGVSHAPEESTGIDAVILAVQAVEGALRELAGA
jgi:allantoate deiminase